MAAPIPLDAPVTRTDPSLAFSVRSGFTSAGMPEPRIRRARLDGHGIPESRGVDRESKET